LGFLYFSILYINRTLDDSSGDLYPYKYDKQDQQGKAAFNERNPHTTQQQEPMARSYFNKLFRCGVNTDGSARFESELFTGTDSVFPGEQDLMPVSLLTFS
jgi:hypothetical protein